MDKKDQITDLGIISEFLGFIPTIKEAIYISTFSEFSQQNSSFSRLSSGICEWISRNQ